MRIYFSPEYSGYCYLNAEKESVFFDTDVVNVDGLLNLLELHGGYHWVQDDEATRVVKYFSAMTEYMSKHPKNELSDSFDNDGLSTARACLHWRDLLVMAGWSSSQKSSRGRIEVLSGIEAFFDSPGLGEHMLTTIKHIKSGCTLPEDMEIILPCNKTLLHPMTQSLLDALEERGVKIQTISVPKTENESDLNTVKSLLSEGLCSDDKLKGDGSFKIYSFPTIQDALLRMSLKDMDHFDVWINADNKTMDNMLYMEGQPVAGSILSNSFPLLSQIYIIGLGMFQKPLNLNNLLAWLQLPVSPIPWSTRKEFVDTIVRTGGYYNDDCRKIYEDLTKKDEKLKDTLDAFLPPLKTPDDVLAEANVVNVEELKDFNTAVSSWLRQRVVLLQSQGKSIEAAQVSVASHQAEAIGLLLSDSHIGNAISYNRLQGWMSSLYTPSSFVQYEAQKGCRNVISSPGKMISHCQSTVWMNFNGTDPVKPSYSFLSPREKSEMPELNIWSEENERRYNNAMQLLPFLFTDKQLILVACESDGTQALPKHPFIIQLENTFKNVAKEPLTLTPSIPEELKVDVNKVENGLPENTEFTIEHGNKLKWPTTESATSLGTLIQNPADYVINNLLHIDATGLAEMNDVSRTKGNVAHAVIATLFDHHNDVPESGTYDYITAQVKSSYDKVFNDTILAEGAILLQSENRVEAKILKDQLRRCILRLLHIIQINNLHVVACEKKIYSENMRFAPNINIIGFLDMRLADANDGQYIFDFKWSRSDGYIYTLQEKRSIQLALYAELVRKEINPNVVAEGYFLMPRGKLYSTYDFAPCDEFELVELNENAPADSTIDMLRNSYAYRRQQITEGSIEVGEGQAVEALLYGKDMEDKHLLPLSADNGNNKYGNGFSDNGLLKGIAK
ncbi:hypothetical protein PRBRB14_21810 [Hallella multisaccharivorax DSM 17128]|uniref:PD-(D/E)XK endonuclease-like domain-containing protein n=1 Tax=Hallella multisaccharivorax DSM 17128 TaxID=688246 RepID=F8N7J6_9BACT|nr:PD-(D/E)XK nuclease family protein [Hallella multisaccharivorax]EGN57456.1 hypothetical protein Premu_2062 [Hallella multisaccharivorax DSM 17128]GJG31302.1 hypothetical protein PRBRB14_21810 [Hallella multisaccharivorax DSM 17128]